MQEKRLWQRIETVPKDGPHVLLARITRDELGDSTIWWASYAQWGLVGRRWLVAGGAAIMSPPTHWMHLDGEM